MKSACEIEAWMPAPPSAEAIDEVARNLETVDAPSAQKPARAAEPDQALPALGTVVAVAQTYESLVAAIRERRLELKLSQLAVDEIAGLQSGYTGKIECGDKRLGAMSLPCILGALGLELAVVRIVPHEERLSHVTAQASCGRADALKRLVKAA